MTLGNCPQTTPKRLIQLGVCMLVFHGWGPLTIAQDLGDVVVGEIGKRDRSILQVNHFLSEGDNFSEEGDLKRAYGAYRMAFTSLPQGEAAQGFRKTATLRYAKSATDYAGKLIEEGYPREAQQILEEVLSDEFVPDYGPAQEVLERAGDPEWAAPGNTSKHREEVNAVTKLLGEATTLIKMGQFDEATNKYSQVLNIDPTNKAARKGLEESIRFQKPFWDAAYDETRAVLLDDIASKWRFDNPDAGVSAAKRYAEQAFTEQDSLQQGESQSSTISSKLNSIIIPEVKLTGVNIGTAVNYLNAISQEYDNTGGDASNLGVRFNISSAAGIDRDRPMNLQMNSVPLIEVLRYMTRFAGAEFRIDQYAVQIVPLGQEDTSIVSRRFTVPPDFFSAGVSDDEAGDSDPFAIGDSTQVERVSAEDFLTRAGVGFPEGASAQYLAQSNALMVRNTFSNLELVRDMVDSAVSEGPKQVVLEVRFLDIRQENLEELGFDWLIDGFELIPSKEIFAGGGQFVPVNDGENFAFTDPDTGQVFGGQRVTGGLRSGPDALGVDALDAIIGADRFTSGVATTTTAPGVISLSGSMTDPQFQAVMRGLSQKKALDVVTAPKVVVKSGQRAKIESGQELIYPVEYDPPELPQEVGAVAGGIFPVTPSHPTTFEMRPLGFTLEVDPVISSDNSTVDVTLAPEFVEFLGFVNYGSPITAAGTDALGSPTQIVVTENQVLMPVFSSVRETLSATIYDGATLVIGGLRQSAIDQINDKVPIMGDLPFIGRLFRSQSERQKNRAVVFFLTARVIDAKGASLNRDSGRAIE